MTPFEFGAWIGSDGSATGFTPMEYMGTELRDGKVSNSSACVIGYDRGRYVLLVVFKTRAITTTALGQNS